MLTLFPKRISPATPIEYGSLTNLFYESAEIVNHAISDIDPYAVCLMLSGGDDSITALKVAMMMGVKIDFVIHGVTGTGLPEVRKYVRSFCAIHNLNLIEADAGDAFEKYVRRKGFFGRGVSAHKFSYHILKVNAFDACISKHIRKGRTGRKIILLNGVRVDESDNRADNFGDNPVRNRKGDYWVNIIHWWTKQNRNTLLESEKVIRNPVSIALGRSGECNCGTMQSEADRIAASEFNPEWGKWLADLRKEITAKFGWDIGGQPNKKTIEARRLIEMNLPDWQPMCVGCKARQHQLF